MKTESLAVSSDKERKSECASKFSLVDVYVRPAIWFQGAISMNEI